MTTTTKGRILRGDLALYDGKNSLESRRDSTGGSISGLPVHDWVDVLQVYGDGENRTGTIISQAAAALGSRSRTLHFAVGTWEISANLTIASNFTCHIPAGCVFNVASGVTLTFSGPIVRESDTWTSGSGTVSFSAVPALSDTSTVSDGAALVGYKHGGSSGTPTTSAAATTVQKKLDGSFDAAADGGAVGDDGTDNAAALGVAISQLYCLLPEGTYQTASALVATDTLGILQGAGWKKDGSEVLTGTILKAASTSVANLLTIQSTSPSSGTTTEVENVRISDLVMIHRGSGSGLKFDNCWNAKAENIYLDCQNEGAIGVSFDNWAFSSHLYNMTIQRYSTYGVDIDGEGSQHVLENCQIGANNTTAVAAVRTNCSGTIIRGGQYNTVNTTTGAGIGIYFYNQDGSAKNGGLVDGALSETEIGIKLDGATFGWGDVVIQNFRVTLGSGQTGVVFTRANDCVVKDPIVFNPNGGTIVEFGANAVRCGLIGNYDACRGNITVDASASNCYIRCNSRIAYTARADLVTDSNLTVICDDVEKVGVCRHNGTNWDKFWAFINDDAFTSITVPAKGGIVKVYVRDDPQASGVYSYEIDGSNNTVVSLGSGSNVEITTGALAGTTGTDGKFVISGHTDSKLYLENRLGANNNVMVIFEPMDW